MKDGLWSRVSTSGKVLFGIQPDNGKQIMALPQFDVSVGLTPRAIEQLVGEINDSPRLRKENGCELLLKRDDTRILIRPGKLIPLDQEAATMLYNMGMSMLTSQRLIPI